MFSLRAPFRTIRALPSPTAAVAATPQLAGRRFYHDKDKCRPRNPGSMDKKDPAVGTGLVGAPACGDVMKLQIRVDEATGTITDAKFKTFGCGSAIASSSYLTELVKGMRLEDASKIRNVDISKELCLPPVKRTYLQRSCIKVLVKEIHKSNPLSVHCSMLAEDAIKAAIADYHGKNPKAKITDLAGTAKTIRETMQQAA
ncbi:iron sulfur cluster assembly protein [Metarhizium acridum CQMa 102]|uniref:Iron sulfur cluster assembly protein n=1 Tax=Metarhizium acridum (strain CQMa 102) TaxID=655827 RepID=E9ED71_METAQ|nr:iron sulfur cluster assembly protein [Metarhizium acridum CQMa 102]EFY86154.1 iron sulfur cluster assembly protein [Metarhizium acridum CQMa 102]